LRPWLGRWGDFASEIPPSLHGAPAGRPWAPVGRPGQGSAVFWRKWRPMVPERGTRAPRGRAIPMKNVREVEKAPVWRRFEKKAARWRSGGAIIGNGRPGAPGERPRGTFRSARRKKMAPRGVREVEMAPGSEDRRPRTSRRRSVHTLQAALNVIGRSIGGRCVHLASERCLPDAQGRVL